jgi:hypothetical protein
VQEFMPTRVLLPTKSEKIATQIQIAKYLLGTRERGLAG